MASQEIQSPSFQGDVPSSEDEDEPGAKKGTAVSRRKRPQPRASSAERALKRRVARNMAERDEPGAVMAFDREIRCLISWSNGVANPQAAVRWWFR